MPDNIISNTEFLWKVFAYIFGLFLTAFLGLWGLIKSGSKWIFGRQIQRIDKHELRLDEMGVAVSNLECNIEGELDSCKVSRKDYRKDLKGFKAVCDDRFDKVADQLERQSGKLEKQTTHINKIDMLLENLIESNKELKKEAKEYHKETKEHNIQVHVDNKKYQEQIIYLLAQQLDKK